MIFEQVPAVVPSAERPSTLGPRTWNRRCFRRNQKRSAPQYRHEKFSIACRRGAYDPPISHFCALLEGLPMPSAIHLKNLAYRQRDVRRMRRRSQKVVHPEWCKNLGQNSAWAAAGTCGIHRAEVQSRRVRLGGRVVTPRGVLETRPP